MKSNIPFVSDYALEYIKTLKDFKPRNISLVLLLMVVTSLTEGIGLLLLIPLIQLVGLDVQQGSLGQIADFIGLFFNYIGITPTLGAVLLIYVLIISLNAFILKIQTTESSKIQYDFAANLRKRLFKSIMGSNWIFLTQKRSSDFAHALTNEIERISMGTGQFLTLIASILILAVYLIFALKLSGLITGLIFIAGVILLLLLKRKTQSSGSIGENVTSVTKNLYSSAIQHLDGMKTVKSFNMEEKNVQEFSDITENVSKTYINVIKSYADVKLLFEIGSVIILSLIVFILLTFVKISTAELLILLFLFVRMIPRFSVIQRSYQNFINMLPAFASVINLEEECKKATEEQEKQESIEFRGKIKFEDISFYYNEEKKSFGIRKLNLNIEAGRTTAIVGLSGAGKSTIADLVMGLIMPDEGKIRVDNKILGPKNASSWRNQIGYVAQETFLFNDSVRNNLLFADEGAKEEDIWKALKSASADKFVLKLPDGLDTLIGDRGVKLSGGEKQRLALARALIRKPKLLILDEATSNLDSKNEKNIMDSIENLHGEITILIIAHRLSTIKNADIIYLVENGKSVESGKWNELLNKKESKFSYLAYAQGIKNDS